MSNDSSALSDITAGLPQDAEYDAVYAAVTATERGRWFLTEYANRNRHADTDRVVSAIARIEAAIAASPIDRQSAHGPAIGAAAERIADITLKLRERAADVGLCDALDAAVREIYDACALPAAVRQVERGTDREAEEASDTGSFEFELQDDKKLAAAAAALAASLTSLSEDSQTARESQNQSAAAVAPPPDREPPSDPQTAEPADRRVRSYIAPPDFEFPPAERHANGHDGELSGQSGQAHPLLPEPELLAGPEDDPADLFEPTPKNAAAASAAPPPAAAMSVPAAAAASEPVQLRIATASAIRPAPRPAPTNPLAALRALSDEELIALFG